MYIDRKKKEIKREDSRERNRYYERKRFYRFGEKKKMN